MMHLTNRNNNLLNIWVGFFLVFLFTAEMNAINSAVLNVDDIQCTLIYWGEETITHPTRNM